MRAPSQGGKLVQRKTDTQSNAYETIPRPSIGPSSINLWRYAELVSCLSALQFIVREYVPVNARETELRSTGMLTESGYGFRDAAPFGHPSFAL